MKLILVKHGETIANSEKILQGNDGDSLTEKGRQQAKEVGKHLKDHHKIEMVFCSPLDQCVETLDNILEEFPIEGEIFMSNLIEERDFGEYTGVEHHMMNWNEVNENNKINRQMGVESLESLEKRIGLFLEDLKLENPEANVLVISHEEPIKMMINKLSGGDMADDDLIHEFDYQVETEF